MAVTPLTSIPNFHNIVLTPRKANKGHINYGFYIPVLILESNTLSAADTVS